MTRRSGVAALVGCLLVGCSEYEVGADGNIDEVAAPRLAVAPAALDFGGHPVGTEVAKTIRISNVGGSTLRVDRLLPGPSGAFSITDPDVGHVIDYGDAVLQEVRYVATTGDDASWVTILSDDPTQPELRVPLSGHALLPELTVMPSPITFADVDRSCVGHTFAELVNTGSAPLTLDAVLVTGEAFELVPPELPTVLAPGLALPVELLFSPSVADVEYLGVLNADSDDPRGPQTTDVSGWGDGPPPREDAFLQVENDWTKADILFFVDQSCSMGDDQAVLADNFDAFLDILTAGAIDYQLIGVTNDDGCHNGSIITPTHPDPVGAFDTATQGPSGAYLESGLIVARNALDATDPTECNAGFLRSGVTPIAVLISDEMDQSPDPWTVYVNDMQAKVPEIVISVVVGDGTCGHSDSAAYHDAAAATGGSDLSICSPDWGDYFYDIIGVIEPPRSTFVLDSEPEPDSIEVFIDGDVATGWAYDPAENAVVFTEVTLPPPASTILVVYDELLTCP